MNPPAGRCFLASFRPLIKTAAGRRAVAKHGLPPFIDGSCRREPDFESTFPSITATCRGRLFAPRLEVGDRVAYITVKGAFLHSGTVGNLLVAVLRVVEKMPTHGDAANWYRARGLALPSNCLVEGNPPKPFDQTNGDPPAEVKSRVKDAADPEKAIRLWDAGYRKRVAETPIFLICEPELLDLRSPRAIAKSDFLRIFGRVPKTLNPPQIACDELEALILIGKDRNVTRQ